MRFRLLAILLAFSAMAQGQSLKNYFKKQDSSLREIQVFKSRADPHILAVIVVDEPDW